VESIRLSKESWQFDADAPLGTPGGFGAVFAGLGPNLEPVAVKQLHLELGGPGHREMEVAGELVGRNLQHVIPILDSGFDVASNRFYVVMARGEESLQAMLGREGRVSEEATLRALDDVAAGLEEISDLVHRDLKPANLILHEGRWKIADLGIARFVANSTSIETLKSCMSPAYASPEQWRLEHATWATDVYALGCIAHALLSGRPPFAGPSPEDFQRQHLFDAPPILPASPRLQQLILKCLSKAPAARVRPSTIRARLAQIRETLKTAGQGPLASAGAKVAAKEAAMRPEQAQAESERRARAELANSGIAELQTMIEDLFSAVENEAAPARRSMSGPSTTDRSEIYLGTGALFLQVTFPRLDRGAFDGVQWDVVAGAVMGVRQQSLGYPGRSANLWYADLDGSGAYRWWEIPYMTNPFIPSHRPDEPFGFIARDQLRHAALAASPVMASYQHAAKPTPIDLELQEAFFSRWTARLALAAEAQLSRPSSLPE
jgi:hypothetical protein